MFKDTISHEAYLDIITIRKFRNAISCFRCSSHDLEIERGRYTNTPRELRICKLCKTEPETEFHFLLKCPYYNDLRVKYISRKYYVNPSLNKFAILMSSKNDKRLLNSEVFDC